jgi:hypothetical protein
MFDILSARGRATSEVRAVLVSIHGLRRGGYQWEAAADDPGRLLRDSFSLRDDEQLLVKLSYRFES